MSNTTQTTDSYNDSDEINNDLSNELSNFSSQENTSEKNDEKLDIDPVKFFTQKELCYYSMIDKFFKNCSPQHINNIIDIIEGRSNISLRILDWFVTKYSKRKIDYGNKDAEIFDVRISYKSQLKSYKKRYFDPFRRRKKFMYYFNNGKHNKSISTTLGQLNFFKWAISNNILLYVDRNLKHISKEMNISNKEEKKKKDIKSNDGKKTEDNKKNKNNKTDSESDSIKDIKINAIKTTENDEVKIVLKFD